MTPAAEFLGARADGDATAFALGDHLRGAFGGIFGGATAAAALTAARRVAAGRRPLSLHCAFLRALPPGRHSATARVVSEGRTATTVSVDLRDSDANLAALATVTFAAGDALVEFDAAPLPSPELTAYDDGWELPLPEGFDPPVMTTLPLRITGTPGGGFAHAIRAPWSEHADTAEAAAMMGDYCAGLPVGAALGREGTRIPVPNPDLSLRFAADAWGDVLVGVGRLARIERGAAVLQVEVWAGPDNAWKAGDPRAHLLAVGVSSAVMLRRD